MSETAKFKVTTLAIGILAGLLVAGYQHARRTQRALITADCERWANEGIGHLKGAPPICGKYLDPKVYVVVRRPDR
jgi:hypothetical protein